MTRRGFTLIEVLVALALTGIVALLVYGTAHAGLDTRERVTRHRGRAEAYMIVRELLVDALRHPQPSGGLAMNDTLFFIDDATDPHGVPLDALRFVSRGIGSPAGTAHPWHITVVPTSAGLMFEAAPPATHDAAPITALVPEVHGMDILVLDRTAGAAWLDRWDSPGRVPAAVAFRFHARDGSVTGAPLVVHTALERVY